MKETNEKIQDKQHEEVVEAQEPQGTQQPKAEKAASDNEMKKNENIDNSTDNPSLEEQVAEAKDKYLRLYSEFENFRRRTSKEKLDMISTANKELMSDLLPVVDDFERAMKAAETSEDIAALKEGMQLIQHKLNKTLQNKGLKRMDVNKGDEFDDEKHEAITQIPAEEGLEGKVVDVVEPGYTLGDSIVRFAKVVVGAKK